MPFLSLMNKTGAIFGPKIAQLDALGSCCTPRNRAVEGIYGIRRRRSLLFPLPCTRKEHFSRYVNQLKSS